tara:strand:+ start:555 stop:1154 length:600 start_codon:yes stop_codon:yes gene_type:complete
MDSSEIYQAPATATLEQEKATEKHALYVVSPTKFSVLFLSIMGIYELYWQYRNWHGLKQNRDLKVIPALRALFSLFFFGSLLKHINNELGDENASRHLPVVSLTTLYVITGLVSYGSDQIAVRMEAYSALDFISLALFPVIWLILLSTQKAINLSQNAPDGETNSRITLANGIWIFLGALLWLTVLAGISSYIAPGIWE